MFAFILIEIEYKNAEIVSLISKILSPHKYVHTGTEILMY